MLFVLIGQACLVYEDMGVIHPDYAGIVMASVRQP